MIKIGFWNLRKNSLIAEAIIQLCVDESCDDDGNEGDCVFAFCEHKDVDMKSCLREIIKRSQRLWNLKITSYEKFAILYNLNDNDITLHPEIYAAVPIRVVRIINNKILPINLVAVHIASPLHAWRGNSKTTSETSKFIKSLQEFEDKDIMQNTIAIGDFNQDPFSDAMLHTDCLNATMCRRIAAEGYKIIEGHKGKEKKQYFYNPTWSLLGSRTLDTVPGSFYSSDHESDCNRWHAIDQLLIRPSVMNFFCEEDFKYLIKVGNLNLVGKRKLIPNKASYSDHLPIIAKWRF